MKSKSTVYSKHDIVLPIAPNKLDDIADKEKERLISKYSFIINRCISQINLELANNAKLFKKNTRVNISAILETYQYLEESVRDFIFDFCYECFKNAGYHTERNFCNGRFILISYFCS